MKRTLGPKTEEIIEKGMLLKRYASFFALSHDTKISLLSRYVFGMKVVYIAIHKIALIRSISY